MRRGGSKNIRKPVHGSAEKNDKHIDIRTAKSSFAKNT